MDQTQERRTSGEARVTVNALVEICGNEPGIPAFEAQSVDVSRRGMHLVTSYVPHVGDPLVCRFEDQGQEIVVEGVVAWTGERAEGGEFGVQFTALDSGSVQALQELCRAPIEPSSESGDPGEAVPGEEPGAKVRLHIEGLGTPMKARVREHRAGSVRVGSNLEFLRVGRHLEIENGARTVKRPAAIDGVSVTVDPKTQIPQLLVTLRYEDVQETTPEPSVIDYEQSEPGPLVSAAQRDAGRADTVAQADAAPTAGEELAERAGQLTASVASWARTACGSVAEASTRAATGLGETIKVSRARLREIMNARGAKTVRRTTALPPGGAVSVQGRRLRPQNAARAPVASPSRVRHAATFVRSAGPKKVGIALGALVLVIAVAAIAMRGGAKAPPGATASASSAGSEVLANNAAAAASAAVAAPAVPSGGVPNTQGNAQGVVADVPLFGPTPMATMEPAPLGPPPEAETTMTEEERERAAAKEAAKDLSFAHPSKSSAASKSASSHQSSKKADPRAVKPWGKGRLYLPTVYRLRLDAPGGALRGTVTATGFSVVVPDRKVMESPRAILKRDRRIARIKSRNIHAGAQLTFEFRGGVPAYRVRLRRDFVEFLISAPDTKKSHKRK